MQFLEEPDITSSSFFFDKASQAMAYPSLSPVTKVCLLPTRAYKFNFTLRRIVVGKCTKLQDLRWMNCYTIYGNQTGGSIF